MWAERAPGEIIVRVIDEAEGKYLEKLVQALWKEEGRDDFDDFRPAIRFEIASSDAADQEIGL